MTLSLALPDAREIGLAHVKDRLLPMCAIVRAEIRAANDLESARELARRLDAFSRYLKDRHARDLVAAETRRTEMLIGHLLGPVVERQRTDLELSHASDRDLAKDDRFRFRLLAEHERLVEQHPHRRMRKGYATLAHRRPPTGVKGWPPS